MENSFMMVAAGIVSGVGLSGVCLSLRNVLRRQRNMAEKTQRTVLEIEGLLQSRR